MSKQKALTSKGIMLFKDYELLFDLISDEELGCVIRKLLKNFSDGKLKKENFFENKKIENVYIYIQNRILDYLKKAEKARLDGIRGGNPTLKGRVKGEDKGRVKGRVNLKERKGRERNISLREKSEMRESEIIPLEILNDPRILNPVAYWRSLPNEDKELFIAKEQEQEQKIKAKEEQEKIRELEEQRRKSELSKPLKEQWTKEQAEVFIENMVKFRGVSILLEENTITTNLIKEFKIDTQKYKNSIVK